MRLKKQSKNKSENIAFRCSKDHYNLIKRKANIYTEGNISEWVLFAAMNCLPDKNDFENDTNAKKPSSKAARKK